MEEIIDLLSAYYTALLEKHYIDHSGRGQRSDLYDFFLAAPGWEIPGNVDMDYTGMKWLVEERYYFWLAAANEGITWDWVDYKDGHWVNGSDVIPENKMSEIIRRSANKLGLELEIGHPSEMSMAARLPDDEMQYEI